MIRFSWLARASGALLAAAAVNGSLFALMAHLNAAGAARPEPRPEPLPPAWMAERPPPSREPAARVEAQSAPGPVMTVLLERSEPEPMPLAPLSAGVPFTPAVAAPVAFQGGPGLVVEDRLDQAPREMANALPVYPRTARLNGQQGVVWVRLLIDENGRVADARLERVSGDAAFGEAVLRAAQDWRFEPARHRGQPVRVWGIKAVRFELREG